MCDKHALFFKARKLDLGDEENLQDRNVILIYNQNYGGDWCIFDEETGKRIHPESTDYMSADMADIHDAIINQMEQIENGSEIPEA